MNTAQCEKIRKHLSDFSVGYVSNRTKALIKEHLDTCTECRKELAALERTSELLKSITLSESPDLWPAIRTKLEPRVPNKSQATAWWFVRYRLQSVLAAILIVLVALSMLMVKNNQTVSDLTSETFLANHATMSWRQPFADKTALGLTAAAPMKALAKENQ